MTMSTLPSLISIRSILKGWFNKVSIVMGEIYSIEARDMDMKLLSAPESNNTLARCWFRRNKHAWQVILTGSRLLPVAGPLFLQFLSAFLTQGTVSSISIIFSGGGSLSPEGFLSSILLWLVIIVAVVSVGITVVVVIIIAVVVVVESSSVVKLSFVIT
ncbi:hypothetical protein Tco_1511267 [Tanacetum coccineum]